MDKKNFSLGASLPVFWSPSNPLSDKMRQKPQESHSEYKKCCLKVKLGKKTSLASFRMNLALTVRCFRFALRSAFLTHFVPVNRGFVSSAHSKKVEEGWEVLYWCFHFSEGRFWLENRDWLYHYAPPVFMSLPSLPLFGAMSRQIFLKISL